MATDSLQIFGTSYTGVTGIKATDSSNGTKTYIRPQGTKSITANGTGIDVTEYASVDVAVSGSSSNILLVTLTQNAQTGYWEPNKTFAEINAAYGNPIIVSATNGDDTAPTSCFFLNDGDDFYYSIVWFDYDDTGHFFNQTYLMNTNGLQLYQSDETVYPPELQAKTNISPTTSSQTISPDSGYDGLSSVQINAMPTMTLPTSASSSATSGYSSKATISRSTSDQYINIPTGYNSAGAYYKVNAVANGSATGPSSLSGSSATVSTGTNTITLTKTGVTTTPTVNAGYVSTATSSTATIALTASVTTKAAATITPGTSNQTIASGTYLTGAQTIEGDADLVASNIISTANIFGVQGSVVIQHYYTGTETPSSSTGVNGDIYLKTT